jgi:hypothetical protein
MPGCLPATLPARRRELPSIIWVTDEGLRTVSALGADRAEMRAVERRDWPLTRWTREAGSAAHVLEVLARGGTIMFTAVLRGDPVDVYLMPHRGCDGRRGALGMAFRAD